MARTFDEILASVDRLIESREKDFNELLTKGVSKMSELTPKEIKALREENERLRAENESLKPVDTSLQARAKSRRSLKEIAKDVQAERAKVGTFNKIELAKQRYR
ncbi:hypothetical protein LC612_31045 [Nostoc sp. CHAB 5834]|nr:hypothetical protein [Nostoc sp. CHAB 5834]